MAGGRSLLAGLGGENNGYNFEGYGRRESPGHDTARLAGDRGLREPRHRRNCCAVVKDSLDAAGVSRRRGPGSDCRPRAGRKDHVLVQS
jgi:hypothetical protein